MKEIWYTAFVLLLLGIIAGMAGLKQTGAVTANLPPEWNLPTNEFMSNEKFELDLTQAFFDPDGDKLSFTAEGATIKGDKLLVEQSGRYNIIASDGKLTIEEEISVDVS